MSNLQFLFTLMRTELEKLEKLQRLEITLHEVPAEERPAIQRKIDGMMEEIANLNRAVQQWKTADIAGQQAGITRDTEPINSR